MSACTETMHIFVRDLNIDMMVGVYDFEKTRPQRVVVNIAAGIIQPADRKTDRLSDWVSYEALVERTRALAAEGHIDMLETFAHRIADDLLQDDRIADLHIRLEKTEIIKGVASVGVELRRDRR